MLPVCIQAGWPSLRCASHRSLPLRCVGQPKPETPGARGPGCRLGPPYPSIFDGWGCMAQNPRTHASQFWNFPKIKQSCPALRSALLPIAIDPIPIVLRPAPMILPLIRLIGLRVQRPKPRALETNRVVIDAFPSWRQPALLAHTIFAIRPPSATAILVERSDRQHAAAFGTYLIWHPLFSRRHNFGYSAD